MSDLKTQQPTTFSTSVANVQVDGDAELLQEIIGIFLTDYPKTMTLIETAVKEQNAENLEHYAHSLKGSASNFGAAKTVELALSLELMGRNKQLENAAANFAQLQQEIGRLDSELKEYRKTL
jgi:HPt (histidine-containing phosphotransfer) domain-containing protein